VKAVLLVTTVSEGSPASGDSTGSEESPATEDSTASEDS
jgi:hypothetical protein